MKPSMIKPTDGCLLNTKHRINVFAKVRQFWVFNEIARKRTEL